MEVTGNENPFYEFYDEVLEICHEYDVTISLGDSAARAVSTIPTTPPRETAEMIELGKLCKRAGPPTLKLWSRDRATWRSTRSPPI